MSWRKVRGATTPWDHVRPPVAPGCTIKQVTELLHGRGLVAGKTVRLSFDPEIARMFGNPEQDSWHVVGTDPDLDIWYSLADCTVTKVEELR